MAAPERAVDRRVGAIRGQPPEGTPDHWRTGGGSMRTRSMGLALFSGVALLVSACTSAATPSPSPTAASAAPSVAASVVASASAPASGSPAPSGSAAAAQWKVGVVTDVGTLDDKNFNQFSFEGAEKGATDIGASSPPAIVPKDSSEYANDIQKFIDQKFNIIVTVGFNLSADTTKAAKANPNVWFVGVDQSPICVDATGALDTTFACAGDAATLLPNYISLTFQEDQAGYLAGIVAASITKTGKIGAIGGINSVPPVVRYIQGYVLGAQSINPNIVVKTAYVTTSDFTKAFNDPATGKTFATQFIKANGVDVLFQVAGKTGNGVLDAACAAKISGIGVDVDQYLSYPAADACIVTSAEKHLSAAVESALKGIADGSAKAGNIPFNAANQGIGVADFHGATVPADLQAKLDAALAAMAANPPLVTCPAKCGTP
jgi:basic membrane protein A and related proteins